MRSFRSLEKKAMRDRWSLYLDDTSILEVLHAKVAEELSGKPSEEQERLRAAYSHWGIPYSPEKGKSR